MRDACDNQSDRFTDDRYEWALTTFSVPTDADAGAPCVELGSFPYPDREDFQGPDGFDEGAWANACAVRESEVREQTLAILNDHYVDTTNGEIRLSEDVPGTIRLYW